jgi:hypothetical protein
VGEIIGLSAAALILGGVMMMGSIDRGSITTNLRQALSFLPPVNVAILAGLAASTAGVFALMRYRRRFTWPDIRRYLLAGLMFFLSSLAYFAIVAALVFWLVPVSGLATDTPVLIAGAYLLAWLAGYVLPGASAGIGVREAAFLILARAGSGGMVDEPALLMLMTLLRLINIFADFLNFTLCMALKRRAARNGTGKA